MAEIYLNADTGNDTTGDGTSGNPYLTISKAHTEATAGDSVILQKSTNSYTFTNQTFTKDLNIRGETGIVADAVFDGADQVISWHLSPVGLTIAVEGLKFQNARSADTSGNFAAPMFRVYDFTSASPTTLTFTSCSFDNINLGAGNLSGGMFGPNNTGSQYFLITLTRCVLTRIRKRSDSVASKGARIFASFGVNANSRLNLINTSIYTDGAGTTALDKLIHLEAAPQSESTITITNTIIQAGGDTLNFGEDYAINLLSFSCFNNLTNVPPASASITEDPAFVDPDNGNLKLRPGSPCIDAGVIQ